MGGVSRRRHASPTLAILICLLAGFAGCADAPASTSTQAGAENGGDASVTVSTGAILVTIVTAELQPVQNAQTILGGTELARLTGPDGTALFDDLEPGPYTVVVAKPGYAAREPKGKLVHVAAGEIMDARMGLDPEIVATEASTYHTTHPFVGFITCSVQVFPTAAQTCGRQAVLGDPNGKSNHAFVVDSLLVQTVVLEARWTPTISAAPIQLQMLAYRSRACTSTACSFSDLMFSTSGASPLYFAAREDDTNNLTRRISSEPAKYPKELYTEVLTHCPPPSCYVSVVLQQKYEDWVTVFYGEQAPDRWSVIV